MINMPDYKEILKNGWHPERDGTSLKGQFKGVLSRSKSPPRREASRPLSALRDPSTFAPPPKRVGTSSSFEIPVSSPSATVPLSPNHSTTTTATALPEVHPIPQHEPQKPPPPYRVDSTGLPTAHFRPPPVRNAAAPNTSNVARRSPPALPPRLPPRNSISTNSPRSASSFSVAAASPPLTNPLPSPTRPQAVEIQPHPSKLPSSFSSPFTPAAVAATANTSTSQQGMTWAQKQSALRTASKFQKDPSSISLVDARRAISTTNNLHQQHCDQVAIGFQTARNSEDKSDEGEKAIQLTRSGSETRTHSSFSKTDVRPFAIAASSGNMSRITGAINKKPPPPPPKRANISKTTLESETTDGTPPPIPTSTRPVF